MMKTVLNISKSKVNWKTMVFVAGAVFVIWAYHNTFFVPFLFDDPVVIRDTNPFLVDPLSWKIFLKSRWLVYVTFAINHVLGGEAVWGYHAFNLTVHLIAGWLFYEIVKRTLKLNPGTRQMDAERISVVAALIWLIHPLQTESVTYLSQRSEVMMGMFFLGMIYSFIRAVTSGKKGKRWYVISVVCCALGAESKEVMVTGPILLLLYDRTFVAKSFREAWAKRKRFYAILAGICWFIFALPFLYQPSLDRSAGFGFKQVTWLQYLRSEPEVLLHYLKLAVWPQPLCLDYGWRIAQTERIPIPSLIVIALLILSLRCFWGRRRGLGFLGLSFFLILSPTSSFIPVADLVFEHRMYLPLAPLVVLAVLGIARWLDTRTSNQRAFVAAGAAIILVFGWMTFQRNADYRTEISIWTDVITKRPDNPRGHYNLGNSYFRAGRFDEAMEHYLEAIRIKPDYADAHNNLGTIVQRRGNDDVAAFHFKRALEINPNQAEASNNMGLVLMEKGKKREAAAYFSEAVRLKPESSEFRNNLEMAKKS